MRLSQRSLNILTFTKIKQRFNWMLFLSSALLIVLLYTGKALNTNL